MTKDLTNLPNHTAPPSSSNMKKMSSATQNTTIGERPRSSQIASHSTFGGGSKGTGSRLNSGGMMSRGFSPSLQQKTGDLGTRSRLPLGSGSYKRSALSGQNPNLNSSYSHANNDHPSGGRQVHLNARPGSAPKLRNSHTPNA